MHNAHAPVRANTLKRPEPLLLPFAGLGADLEPAIAAAKTLRLSLIAPREGRRPAVLPAAPPRAHGYGLLLALCRETLGS